MRIQTALVAVSTALLGASACVFTPVAQASIRSECIKEWRSDYRMIEYCIKKQTAAYNTVRRLPNNKIKRYCRNEWGQDYRMVSYCYDKQATSKANLGL